jgi:transcription antitermination protein NusB
MLALQYLFERDFLDVEDIDSSNFALQDLLEITDIEEYDLQLFESITTNIKIHVANIDQIISKLAPEWPISKIAKTDLNILRIAILEGFLLKITPEKVAINEAIELAKEFSNEQSRKFVNGVLGNLLNNIAIVNN